jgi:hemerythrin-like domain-containing protein
MPCAAGEMKMKSTNFLTQEHKLILRALDVLDAMSASIEKTASADQADADSILDFLRWFADAHHQAKEETILFPVLKSMAASQGRPVDHMTLEHDQERSLVEDLEKDVRLAHLSDFVACANRLSSTLRNHIYKEDRILFETAESLLTAVEDDAVFERLSRFDTPLDKEALQKRIEDLRSLEWKYLRK